MMKFRTMMVYGEMHRIIECCNLGKGGRFSEESKKVTIPFEYSLDKNGNKITDENGRVEVVPKGTFELSTFDSNDNPHTHRINDGFPIFIDPLLIIEDEDENGDKAE